MAIVNRVSESEAGRPNVTGPVKNVYGHTYYLETTYVGRVVETGEHNWRDDSDFFAVVEEPAGSGEFREVEYATTRFPTYDNHASVDATPEVTARYHAYLEARAMAARKFREEKEAKVPRRGRTAKVVRGRKVALGTVGTVVWFGPGNYGRDRVGIKDATGKVHFTDACNVEVIREGADDPGLLAAA